MQNFGLGPQIILQALLKISKLQENKKKRIEAQMNSIHENATYLSVAELHICTTVWGHK